MKCILAEPCNLHNGPDCTRICSSYIALHGLSGTGGRVGASNIPDAYRNLTLSTSPARESQSTIYAALAEYVATFTRQFNGDASAVKSLYLYSATPGTGKTTTAAALINEWLAVHYIGSVRRGRAVSERPAYFLDINAWQTDYNGFNRPRVPEEIAAPAAARYYGAQRIAMSVPFLVADDIGVRDASESFRADLHTVINARVAAQLPTIYTSNIRLAELDSLFDRRLADRIRDQCVEFTFTGESKRGLRKAEVITN